MGAKISCKSVLYDVDMVEESIYNEHYLTEDISVDECKIFFKNSLKMLGFFIRNVACLGGARHNLDHTCAMN